MIEDVKSNLSNQWLRPVTGINYTSKLFWQNNMEAATKMIRAGHLRNCRDILYNAAVEDALTTFN